MEGKTMANKWTFRFLGPMPRGKFEFVCICGNYNLDLNILPGKEMETFRCPKCGAEITVRDQKTHWHLFIQEQ